MKAKVGAYEHFMDPIDRLIVLGPTLSLMRDSWL